MLRNLVKDSKAKVPPELYGVALTTEAVDEVCLLSDCFQLDEIEAAQLLVAGMSLCARDWPDVLLPIAGEYARADNPKYTRGVCATLQYYQYHATLAKIWQRSLLVLCCFEANAILQCYFAPTDAAIRRTHATVHKMLHWILVRR